MTNAPSSRPDCGLSPEAALERWSDPKAYAAMREYWEHRKGKLIRRHGQYEKEPNHQEYLNRREPLEQALLEKLRSRQLVASGIPRRTDGRRERVVIHSSYFHKGWIRYDIEEVGGNGPGYERPEIFTPDALPDNIETIPNWLAELTKLATQLPKAPDGEVVTEASLPTPSRPSVTPYNGYRQVEINGVMHKLSPKQAKVIKALDEARLSGNPWVTGDDLLIAAGSSSATLYQLFRNYPGG